MSSFSNIFWRIPLSRAPVIATLAAFALLGSGCSKKAGGARGDGPTLLDQDEERYAAEEVDDGACVDADPYKVLDGVAYTRCDGSSATGKLQLPSGLCKEDGQVNCIATQDFRAAEVATLAEKLPVGTTAAGVEGKFQPDYPDRSNVLDTDTANGEAGTLTLPLATNVLVGTPAFGSGSSLTPTYTPDFPARASVLVNDTVDGASGTLPVPDYPDKANVLSTDTVAGLAGTLTLPTVGNVISGTPNYGPDSTLVPTFTACTYPPAAKVLTGTNFAGGTIGSLTLPPADRVLSSVGAFGEAGTSLTPTLTLPPGSKCLTGSGLFGIAGTGSTPALIIPAAANVLSGTAQFGASDDLKTPSLAVPDAGKIQFGYTVSGVVGTLFPVKTCKSGRGYYDTGALTTLYTAGAVTGTDNSVDDFQSGINPFYGKAGSGTSGVTDDTTCGGTDQATLTNYFLDRTDQDPSTDAQAPFSTIYRDTLTGLYVTYAGDGAKTWNDALAQCVGLNGLASTPMGTGWHLPTQKELYQLYIDGVALVDRLANDGFAGGVIDTGTTLFWSSTTKSQATSRAYQMNLATGSAVDFDKSVTSGRVLCVRP